MADAATVFEGCAFLLGALLASGNQPAAAVAWRTSFDASASRSLYLPFEVRFRNHNETMAEAAAKVARGSDARAEAWDAPRAGPGRQASAVGCIFLLCLCYVSLSVYFSMELTSCLCMYVCTDLRAGLPD